MSRLASVYYLEGKYAQAEALDNQTLEIQRRVLGPEHPDTLESMSSLAGVYYVRASTPRPRRSTVRPWRSGAACWVPSIPTRWIP